MRKRIGKYEIRVDRQDLFPHASWGVEVYRTAGTTGRYRHGERGVYLHWGWHRVHACWGEPMRPSTLRGRAVPRR